MDGQTLHPRGQAHGSGKTTTFARTPSHTVPSIVDRVLYMVPSTIPPQAPPTNSTTPMAPVRWAGLKTGGRCNANRLDFEEQLAGIAFFRLVMTAAIWWE